MYMKKVSLLRFEIEDKLFDGNPIISSVYPILNIQEADIKIWVKKDRNKRIIFDDEDRNYMLYAKFLNMKDGMLILLDVITGEVYSVDPIFIYTFMINMKTEYYDFEERVSPEYVANRFKMNTTLIRDIKILFNSNNKIIRMDKNKRFLNVFDVRDSEICLNPLYSKICYGYDEYEEDNGDIMIYMDFDKKLSFTTSDTEKVNIEIRMEKIDDTTWLQSRKNKIIVSSRDYIESVDLYNKSIYYIAEKVSF